ncbi:MAG: hypothetical protein H7281_01935 [Bacteriovorax sp.]|nr:hypothetical protein [Bacteriovorax sp.]
MKNILKIQILTLLFLSYAFAGQSGSFPTSPNPSETPGKLCDSPTTHR